jgi:ABC-type Mn2+/Zn2+ transport system ATPase subunit
MPALVTFHDVALGYGRHVVLRGLNFAIERGEFFGIVGANGSGKTTILRALLGIVTPRQGRIVWAAAPGRFGYVPQKQRLDDIFPVTAAEVVRMGRWPDRDGPVDRFLELAGIAHLARRWFRDLSGGEQQRVLIARALATESPILVLDEPTDGMDLEGQQAIVGLIGRLRAATPLTVVFVTHRLNELVNVADRIMLLHEGVARVGPVEALVSPAVLREVYGVETRVETVAGKRVVVW